MFFSTSVSLASAALIGLAVADWDGMMRNEDAFSQSIGCGITDVKYGGLPSDSEYEELCTSANTFPCDGKIVTLSDNGPGGISYAPSTDVDCVIAGPLNYDDCKGAFVNCASKTVFAGVSNRVGTCYVRNGDDTVVASIGITAACQPIPGLPPKARRDPRADS